MDDLEKFILEGNERDVNAWWAEKGMGLDNNGTYLYARASGGHSIYVESYTTDRALRYVIEDRVLGPVNPVRWEKYDKELSKLTGAAECQQDWSKTRRILRASNRTVILAAARAMGLEHESTP